MLVGTEGLRPGSWTLWTIGMLFVIARFASRRFALGAWRKLQMDDYLMALCAVTFTGVTVCSNQVGVNGSNYASDEDIATWTPAEVEDAVWGSKMLLALEEFMLATVWLVKACLLILYGRLTSGLAEAYAVKAVAVYCVVGYAVIQILYLGVWCRPLHDYWAVPVPPGHEQCATYRHHMITVTAFHVSSDLMMLLIPVPMIARARLPLLRKIILCIVFSLGLLVVLVAILNRYYNFTETNSLVFLIWYNGEASTAVMVANIPFLWTLLRRIFRLDAWSGSSRSRRSRNTSGARRLDDRYVPGSGPSSGAAGTLSPMRRSLHPSYHDALIGIGATTGATTTTTCSAGDHDSMERMTELQTRDASLYHLNAKMDAEMDAQMAAQMDVKTDAKKGPSAAVAARAEASSDGGDTDVELGL